MSDIRKAAEPGMLALALVLDDGVVCIGLLILCARILFVSFLKVFSFSLALLTIIVGNLCCSFLALLVSFMQVYDDMMIIVIILLFILFGMLCTFLK